MKTTLHLQDSELNIEFLANTPMERSVLQALQTHDLKARSVVIEETPGVIPGTGSTMKMFLQLTITEYPK